MANVRENLYEFRENLYDFRENLYNFCATNRTDDLHSFQPIDIKSNYNLCLKIACDHGHTDLVRMLIIEYKCPSIHCYYDGIEWSMIVRFLRDDWEFDSIFQKLLSD